MKTIASPCKRFVIFRDSCFPWDQLGKASALLCCKSGHLYKELLTKLKFSYWAYCVPRWEWQNPSPAQAGYSLKPPAREEMNGGACSQALQEFRCDLHSSPDGVPPVQQQYRLLMRWYHPHRPGSTQSVIRKGQTQPLLACHCTATKTTSERVQQHASRHSWTGKHSRLTCWISWKFGVEGSLSHVVHTA